MKLDPRIYRHAAWHILRKMKMTKTQCWFSDGDDDFNTKLVFMPDDLPPHSCPNFKYYILPAHIVEDEKK